MDRQAAFTVIRDTHPRAIQILLLLWLHGRPVTKTWVQEQTNCDRKTADKYLTMLAAKGWVEHPSAQKWCIASGATQLMLPLAELLLPEQPPQLKAGKNPGFEKREKIPVLKGEVLKARDFPALELEAMFSEEDLKGGEIPGFEESEKTKTGKNPAFEPTASVKAGEIPALEPKAGVNPDLSSSTTTTTYSSDTDNSQTVGSKKGEKREKIPVSPELRAALREVGIGMNRWAEIAACAWVTPRYVRAMAARVRNEPREHYRNTGFLIHCILKADPEPEWCEECDGLHGGHGLECSQFVNPYGSERDNTPWTPAPPPSEAERIWQATLAELELQMTRDTFNTWLRPTQAVAYSFEDGTLVIGVETEYVEDWLSNRLLDSIQRAVKSVVGKQIEVKFQVRDEAVEPVKV